MFSPSFLQNSISTLPKINRIVKEPIPLPSQLSTKTASVELLSKDNYLSIYKNLTIVFIGDNSIRILYRDLCKVLTVGGLLDYTAAKCANGDYTCIPGETRIKEGGTIGFDDYKDVRQFDLAEHGIKLIYIFVSTLLQDYIAMDAIDSFDDIDDLQSIDAVVFCSYQSDINSKKISQLNVSFDEYFNNYVNCLNRFSTNLLSRLRQINETDLNLYYMSPYPQSPTLTDQETNTFEKNICDIDHILNNQGFLKVDRYDLWQRRKDLIIASHGNFSLHGVREINDTFARVLAYKLHRPFPSSIQMTPTPLTYLDPDASSSLIKKKSS